MAQDFLWAIKTDSDYSTSQTRSIITDSKGNIYSTGDFTGTIDFDPSDNSSYLSSTSGGLSDSFILKLDKDKNFLWVKQITSEWLGVGYSIVLDKNENVIVTGLSSGTQIDLNPDPSETFFVENPTNQPGSYVIKLNSNGKFIFGNYYYGAFADESTVDNNNNIITTGTFGGINTDFDFSNNVYLLNPTSGDIFLLKNDSNGHFIWAKKIGGSQRDFAISLTCDKLNDIILKGRFENNISFSNKDYVTQYNTNFICKISEVGKDIWFRQLGYDSGMISNEDKSVKTDDANNIYFTSNYSNLEIPLSFDFGNTKLFLKEKEGGSVFLKLNQNGEYLWNNYIYGDETNETFSLSFDNNYNIYLVTSTRANTYVNNNCNKVYPYKNIGSSNQFLLLKFTQNGKFINFKNIQSGFYVQSDFEDNIFLSGGFRDMPDFDPSPQSSFYMHSFYGSAYILKLAPCTSSIPEADNNQYFCSSAHPTISDLKPCIEIINWYESKTSNIPLERNLPLENGKTYYAAYFESCPENDRLEVTVHLTPPSTLPSITNLAFCKKDNPKLSDITILGSNLKWYSSSTGGNILPPSTLLQSNTIYYVTQNENINGCESTRVPVIPELNGDDLIINTPQTFCIQQNATLDNIAITGQNIKWYDAATAGTLLPKTTLLQNNVTYYATQTISGCESDRFAVIAKIENTLSPTGDANQPFCSGSNPTIVDIIVTGDLLKWYDAASNGTLLQNTTSLQDGKTYYVSQTANNCESQRFAVTVSVKNTPLAPLQLNSRAFCKNENATLNDIQIDGQNLKWYNSNIAASTLPNTTLLENNTTYYVSQTTGCESERTPILIKVNDTNLPIAKAEQSFCIDQNATIADINIQGTAIIWYDSATAGNILSETTLLENKTYYATQTLNTCESKRFAVTVKIQDTQNPISKSPQSFCIQKNAKISDIDIKGENIKWFESLSVNTTLSESTLLQNGITYYASQTINNCESDRIPVTIKVLEATTGDCINFVDELPFPKFFTPNNDSFNDYWTIDFAYLAPNTGIKIFDRYGKLIKELVTNGIWDGNYLGNPQPSSDYWFTVTRLNGTEYRGHFSLKR